MAGRESRNWFVFGKIRKLEMSVSDCIQKVNVSGQAFCSWCHETIRFGPINQHFAQLFLCVCQVTSLLLINIILFFATFGTVNDSDPGICRGNKDSHVNENRKLLNKIFSKGKN